MFLRSPSPLFCNLPRSRSGKMEIMNHKNQLLLLLLLISVASTMANPIPSASSPAAEPPLSLLNPIPINYFDPSRSHDQAAIPSSFPLPLTASQQQQTDAYVKSVCNKTEDPTLCISVILPLLSSSSSTDPASILTTCINVAIRANQLAALKFKALSRGPNPPSPKCYKGCLKNFESAIGDLKDALEMFQERSAHRVSVHISAGFHAAVECEDDFKDSPGTDGLIAKTAGSLKNVSGICIDIAGTSQIF